MDKIVGVCYFCGEVKEIKGMVKCNDFTCDENHAVCNDCLAPAIEKFFADRGIGKNGRGN